MSQRTVAKKGENALQGCEICRAVGTTGSETEPFYRLSFSYKSIDRLVVGPRSSYRLFGRALEGVPTSNRREGIAGFIRLGAKEYLDVIRLFTDATRWLFHDGLKPTISGIYFRLSLLFGLSQLSRQARLRTAFKIFSTNLGQIIQDDLNGNKHTTSNGQYDGQSHSLSYQRRSISHEEHTRWP